MPGKLIETGTGQPLDRYAAEKPFAPLGIETFEWVAGADGAPSAASGLRPTLPDLVRIGQMVADHGVHDGRQIVPREWLARSFEPRAVVNDGTHYSCLWYLVGAPERTIAVAVDPGSWQTSVKVLLDFAVPEARRLPGR